MARVGIAVHRFREDAVAIGRTVATWCTTHGHSAVVSSTDATALGDEALGLHADDLMQGIDVLVSIGGDGTMLRAVAALDGRPVPVIGVNVGQLGYLASVEAGLAVDALEVYLTSAEGRRWRYDDRMMLRVQTWSDGAYQGERRALNEVVVEKRETGHTARLSVDIDGAHFTTYVTDGLIVASPTGSTAYSMSARGPIASPRVRAMLLTPVSPHMLFDRSLVLEPSERIRIEVLGHRGVNVAADGDVIHTLRLGDVVEVDAAAEIAKFVRFEEMRFHQVLKSKFGLADR